jgi:hypothetical protein
MTTFDGGFDPDLLRPPPAKPAVAADVVGYPRRTLWGA